jgi:hypothetical protein
LLEQSQDQDVLTACLQLLGDEAKEDARRLLEKCKVHPVLTACLLFVGDEAKEDARCLLEESQDQQVQTACLQILGDEAKEDARRLLEASQDQQVQTACLRILGDEAKEDARRLLEESPHPYVHLACLKLLKNDSYAHDYALRLLDNWKSTNHKLINQAFVTVGDNKDFQDRVLSKFDDDWNKYPSAYKAIILRTTIDSPIRLQRAHDIVKDWRKYSRHLVSDALTVFYNCPDKVATQCESIVLAWERELNYAIKNRRQKYSGHIIKAMAHPSLKILVKKSAKDMLIKESKSPGFLDKEMKTTAENILAGRFHPWSKLHDGEVEHG